MDCEVYGDTVDEAAPVVGSRGVTRVRGLSGYGEGDRNWKLADIQLARNVRVMNGSSITISVLSIIFFC